MKPKKLTKPQLIAALKDILDCVEHDDSFHGRIEYDCMDESCKPGEFLVSALWATGNSEGQGGCAIIEDRPNNADMQNSSDA